MKYFIFVATLLLSLSGVFSKRTEDIDIAIENRKYLRNSGKLIAGKTREYRCVSSAGETNNFDCSTNSTKCDPNDQFGCAKCKLVTCKDTSGSDGNDRGDAVKTIEELERNKYKKLDFLPYACVPPGFVPDENDKQCVHQLCHNGAGFTQKGSCAGNLECKLVHCMARYVAKNNVLSGANTPGLFLANQIEEGHDQVTFAPWKCVPQDFDESSPQSNGELDCNSYDYCYDKKVDPLKSGNKCGSNLKCVFLETCPYVVMHKEFNKMLYGASERTDWSPESQHGRVGNNFAGIHYKPTPKPT